jgi:hypothetical protein
MHKETRSEMQKIAIASRLQKTANDSSYFLKEARFRDILFLE